MGIDIPLCILVWLKINFYMLAELQVRGGIKDNLEIFFSNFSMKIYIVIPH